MGSKVARFRIGRPLTRPAGSSPAPSTNFSGGQMHPTIEALKAEALRQIRTNRPQRNAAGMFVCGCCGQGNADRGFQFWHKCDGRDGFGITLRPVSSLGGKKKAARLTPRGQ